jgi:hypothetical protein
MAESCAVRDVSFNQFFSKFIIDKNFDISRTIYPLTVYYSDEVCQAKREDEPECRKVSYVSKKDYLTTATLATTMKEQSRLSKVKTLTKERAVVIIYLPDSDWLDIYNFKNKEGCWYLSNIQTFQ